MSSSSSSDFERSSPYWLRRIGVHSWLLVGFVLALVIFAGFFAALDDLLIPLIISVLLAILFSPLVDWLQAHKVSRPLGTILSMIIILSGLVGLIVIVIKGIIQQGPEIAFQLQSGWLYLQAYLSEFDILLPSAAEVGNALSDALPSIFEGFFGFLGSTFSRIISLFVGLYFGTFILFFLLRDTLMIKRWLSGFIHINTHDGMKIVEESSQIILVYFRGTALTALITSVVVAIPLFVLKVPLVGSILIIYFFTSFIPYLGAWIAGAFAVLIALGYGGVETALVILIAVIVSNGVLQSVVNSWALGSMLKIHPLVIFLVTIIAGIIGGILLMILAVPLTAIAIQIMKRFKQDRKIQMQERSTAG